MSVEVPASEESSRGKGWAWKLLQIIPVLLFLLTLWKYWQDRQRHPEIEVAIVNLEHLPPRSNIPDLKLSTTYRDRPVDDLWIVKVRAFNTGNVTIYCDGPKKNVLNGIIRLYVPNFEIIDLRKDNSNFTCDVQVDPEEIRLYSTQWRKGEWVDFSLYLGGKPTSPSVPVLQVRDRDLIDGDVIPRPYSYSGPILVKTVLDRTFPKASMGLRLWASFTVGIGALLFLMLPFAWWDSYRTYRRWWKEHAERYKSWVASLAEIPTDWRDEYARYPEKLPKFLWEKFSGPKCPQPPFDVTTYKGPPTLFGITLQWTFWSLAAFLGAIWALAAIVIVR